MSFTAGLERGDSDSFVLQSFVQKYGNTVLAAPTTTGFNGIAWIMPFAIFACGVILTIWIVRSWKARAVTQPVRAPTSRRNNSTTFVRRRVTRRNFDVCLYAIALFQCRGHRQAARWTGWMMGQETVLVLFGCALFAAALFVYVFYRPDTWSRRRQDAAHLSTERKEATYENLRDLNFEYKAGKLGEKITRCNARSLEDEAAAILAELESIEKARQVVRHGTRRAGVPPNGGRANLVRAVDLKTESNNPVKCGTSENVIPSEDFSPSRGTCFGASRYFSFL